MPSSRTYRLLDSLWRLLELTTFANVSPAEPGVFPVVFSTDSGVSPNVVFPIANGEYIFANRAYGLRKTGRGG